MPGVMPRTGGRAAGLWKRPRPCAGGREPQGDKRSRQTKFQAWRAVCCESSLHGSGRGWWKRAVFMKPPEEISGGSEERTAPRWQPTSSQWYPQVLCAWSSLHWLNPSSQRSEAGPSQHTRSDDTRIRIGADQMRNTLLDRRVAERSLW
jgi:hypothetical protein